MLKTKIAMVPSEDKTSFLCKEGLLRYFFSGSKLLSPKLLLLTTFHMNVEFLVNEVLTQIPNDCKTIIFYSPFASNKIAYNIKAERKNIRFVRARSTVFHPKFLVAIAGGNILVGVGSANLTKGGWGGHNQELYHLYGCMSDELFSDHIGPLNSNITGFCDKYLETLMKYEIHPASNIDKMILQDMKISISPRLGMKGHTEPKTYPELIHNYHRSFLSFIKDKKIRNLRHIHIFSPIHFRRMPAEDEMIDNVDENNSNMINKIDYPLFKDFIALFPDRRKAAVSFYSSNEVDKEFLRKGLPVTFYRNPDRSHLKVIIFETFKTVFMLSGSANFSINALKKRPANGGNSEIMHFDDITGKWPKLREFFVGKFIEKQEGTDYPSIKHVKKTSGSVLSQMDVFEFRTKRKARYEVHIYKNPEIKTLEEIRIEYSDPQEESQEKLRIKLPKITLDKQITKIMCNGSWVKLIKDRPLFCSYKRDGFEFSFPVNYNFSEADDESLTEAEKEYTDLFSFYGCKWRKGSPTNRIAGPPKKPPGEDDGEPENIYQSKNDRFYHDWKHVYHMLKMYKKKKNMRPLYEAGKKRVEMFLERYDSNPKSSSRDDLLTRIQINFIKDNILTI